MTSSDPISRASRRSDNHIHILRLNRLNHELSQLNKNLCSYVCEPQTRMLFLKKESLTYRLSGLRQNNDRLILILRTRQSPEINPLEKMKEHFNEYHSLELEVLEYIGMAKLHG